MVKEPIYSFSTSESAPQKKYFPIRNTTETAFIQGVFNLGLYVAFNYMRSSFSENQPHLKGSQTIQVRKLNSLALNSAMDVIVEPDADGYIARIPGLNLYGYGEDIIESIYMLNDEIESLYYDLNSDSSFSEEWESVKQMLNDIIVPTNG